MEELLASDSHDEFLLTKGGILALQKVLDLRIDLRERIGMLEEERKFGR